MQERDRNAEPNIEEADRELRLQYRLVKLRRFLVDAQLCIDEAGELLDPAARLQPLGSDAVVSSQYHEDDPPRLILHLPEWPPKLRPHEAGAQLWMHMRGVRMRWEMMIQRALEAGGLQGFEPRWREATILFTFFVPYGKLGDPDHFAQTFIINALRKFRVIEDDGWQNITIGGVRVASALPNAGETVVMVLKGHYWLSNFIFPPPAPEENPFAK